MWDNYIKSGKQPNLYETHKEKLKSVQSANRSAKLEFDNKLAKNIKNDSKSFYSYVKNKQICSVKVEPLRDSLGNITIDDAETANILNEYFGSVFTRKSNNIVQDPVIKFTGQKV